MVVRARWKPQGMRPRVSVVDAFLTTVNLFLCVVQNLMKRLILNRRIAELQAQRLRTRCLSLLGLAAVGAAEYAALDVAYNHPSPRPAPRVTAKMKQLERKRLAHQAQAERERLERKGRFQPMDEA
jgi:hypothetical protein